MISNIAQIIFDKMVHEISIWKRMADSARGRGMDKNTNDFKAGFKAGLSRAEKIIKDVLLSEEE